MPEIHCRPRKTSSQGLLEFTIQRRGNNNNNNNNASYSCDVLNAMYVFINWIPNNLWHTNYSHFTDQVGLRKKETLDRGHTTGNWCSQESIPGLSDYNAPAFNQHTNFLSRKSSSVWKTPPKCLYPLAQKPSVGIHNLRK